MKIKKYLLGAAMAVVLAIGCSPDPNLYPLPYDSRETGSYLRVYQIVSNTWDLDDLANSGFTAIYESVDKAYGANLAKIEFYATYRKASTGFITDEVLVKTVDAAGIAAAFSKVPAPTASEYLRSTPITVTHAETLAALSTLTVDPDGTTCSGIFPDVCTMVQFVGPLAAGDRIIFRVAITDNKGRLFTVANPQTTVTPALGNPNEANITPNLTGGLFYNSPMLYTMTMVRTTTTGNANAYTGDYLMTQVARWQPDHSASQHQSFPQGWIDQFVFGNSATDSTQVVTLSKVTGGLPSQRQFTAKYRGQSVTIKINLENTATGLSAGAITTLGLPANTPGQAATTAQGFGFPAGTTTGNLGTVWVPLFNTGVDCTGTREFYQVTPLGGTFAGTQGLPWGLPRATVPNRGAYRNDRDGLTVGDVFCIGIDDDADEYGRRNGYCEWYTRVQLTLRKL